MTWLGTIVTSNYYGLVAIGCYVPWYSCDDYKGWSASEPLLYCWLHYYSISVFIMKLLVATLIFSPLTGIQAFPIGNNRQDRPAALNWAPCDFDFGLKPGTIEVPIDCAKLEVPLDYTEPESSEMLQLQLLKVNATKKPFKGSVLFNPGGPGGSGVELVVIGAPIFDRYVFTSQHLQMC